MLLSNTVLLTDIYNCEREYVHKYRECRHQKSLDYNLYSWSSQHS